MNPVPIVVGVAAVAGLVVAWRGGTYAPLFIGAGVAMCALAGILMLLRNPLVTVFLAMLAVPYWAAWLFVYTVRRAAVPTK